MNGIHMRSDGNDGNDGEKVYTKNFVILASSFSFIGGCFISLLIEYLIVHDHDHDHDH